MGCSNSRIPRQDSHRNARLLERLISEAQVKDDRHKARPGRRRGNATPLSLTPRFQLTEDLPWEQREFI